MSSFSLFVHIANDNSLFFQSDQKLKFSLFCFVFLFLLCIILLCLYFLLSPVLACSAGVHSHDYWLNSHEQSIHVEIILNCLFSILVLALCVSMLPEIVNDKNCLIHPTCQVLIHLWFSTISGSFWLWLCWPCHPTLALVQWISRNVSRK